MYGNHNNQNPYSSSSACLESLPSLHSLESLERYTIINLILNQSFRLGEEPSPWRGHLWKTTALMYIGGRDVKIIWLRGTKLPATHPPFVSHMVCPREPWLPYLGNTSYLRAGLPHTVQASLGSEWNLASTKYYLGGKWEERAIWVVSKRWSSKFTYALNSRASRAVPRKFQEQFLKIFGIG